MKRLSIALFLLIPLLTGLTAQEGEQKETKEELKKEQKFGLNISGFVKNDFFYDTRQTVTYGDGNFLLWPEQVLPDENGEDINAGANFNILALQSRLSFALTGPDALGAKTSGLIEGDFFAQDLDNINLFRLRHAYLQLTWTHLEVMAGQYWNPLFVSDCFPGTVSFNTGTPLQSYAYNPQIRVSYRIGELKILAAALSQRDFASTGSRGSGTQYLRNSGIPDMHLRMQYGLGIASNMNLLVGAGMAYKILVPRLSGPAQSGNIQKLDEKVKGFTFMSFALLKLKPLTAKFQFRYGENLTDVMAISGFAVTETDPLTGNYTYTPLKGITFWGEVHTNGNPQVGVFGGLTLNNGTKEEMDFAVYPVYGNGTNIHSLFRISPRVLYNAGPVRMALEIEYTSAAYGSAYDTFHKPAETTRACNLRSLLALYYFF
jgi:hypothetical protein